MTVAIVFQYYHSNTRFYVVVSKEKNNNGIYNKK